MTQASRVISPKPEDIERLRQPLTSGEKAVFHLFNETLDHGWEIYLQPHLNGLRPDFVLLNPNVGIAVFEVKDSDFSALEIDAKTLSPVLEDPAHRRALYSAQMRVKGAVEQLHLYKNELSELYCPRLDQKAALAVVTAGLIFPNTPDNILKSILLSVNIPNEIRRWTKYYPIAGQNSLDEKAISNIFPESSRRSSFYLNEEKAKDLRSWLIEPDFVAAQRRPLVLDDKQRNLVLTRTKSGYRRIKGPAGSGKSLVLAARASELASEGKSVAAVTYNITLLHYLRDLCVRWKPKGKPTFQNITWVNFHLFCRRMCIRAGYKENYDAVWKSHFDTADNEEREDAVKQDLENVLANKVPALMLSLFGDGIPDSIPPFDAILVDEGQDFLPAWWNVLRLFARKNAELLLAADSTQDIYGSWSRWTDQALVGAGFPGGTWASLETSYRLPNAVIPFVKEFASIYMPRIQVDLPNPKPQQEFDYEPTSLRWVQCNKEVAHEVCAAEIRRQVVHGETANLAFPEVIFLCSNTSFGRGVVEVLNDKGIKCLNTFHENKRLSKKQKMSFFMGDARVKATSLHSFKGWESRSLVIYVASSGSDQARALLYTGLTRLKASPLGSMLTIVCSDQAYRKFGKSWPEFHDVVT